MAESRPKGYRRSWRNLLINKGYQLRFTLFMVGLSALLMVLLGLWVMRKAETATTVSADEVAGRKCPEIPALAPGASRPAHLPAHVDDGTEEGAAGSSEAAAGAPEPAGGAEGSREPAAGSEPSSEPNVVTVEVGNLQPVAGTFVPPEFVAAVIERYQCRLDQIAQIKDLQQGYRRILYVLIAVGLLLVIGLTIYGIKMTHRVAGPLHKVSLYFDKMRDGIYGPVYDLRKGDQLVEFYESFKTAHGGLRTMQQEDIAVLREMLKAADAGDLGARSPELAAVLDELRATLERKEKSLD